MSQAAGWARTAKAVLSSFAAFLISTAAAIALDLPERPGPRPDTTKDVPHIQIGVEPLPEINAELLRRVAKIPDVEIRDTVISLPGAKGFWLNDQIALARPESIVGGREFAHMHPDGSLHASLEPEFATKAIKAGWAVLHPWAGQRPGWDGFVMIYTPTTAEELDVVIGLVVESYKFVTGRKVAGVSD